MALVPMRKIAVVCARDNADDVLRFLQERGVMEVTKGDQLSDNFQAPDGPHGSMARAEVEAAYQKAQVEFALNALLPYASEQTKKKKLPKDPQKIEQAALTGEFSGIIERISEIESEFAALDRKEQDLRGEYEMLRLWDHYPYAGDPLRNIIAVDLVLGVVPTGRSEMLIKALEKDNVFAELSCKEREDQTYVMAYVWSNHRKQFGTIAAEYGWTDANVTLPWRETPQERITAIKKERTEILHEREKMQKELSELSKHVPYLRKVYQYFTWLEDEQHAREYMKYSTATAVMFGWVPREEERRLAKDLAKKIPASDVFPVAPRKDEEPPVLLRNSVLVRPFLSVTELYGLPKPNEFDPTALLAPFFIVFFALCLTDAGYGLAMTLVFGAAIFFKRITMKDSPLIWLLFFGGIVTLLVGIPFGGWFGLTPDRVSDVLTVTAEDGTRRFVGQIWNLSSSAGVTFLQNISIVLGIVHLSFGMFLAGWHKWIYGQRRAAMWQDFTSHVLIAAGIAFFFAPEQWKAQAMWVVIAAVALFIWGKGYGEKWYVRPVYGLMGFANFGMSMVSNLISYLRLLALGLVTGAIALAVNEVAGEVSALFPVVLGIPAVVALFLIGHTISIALNGLGSFVHSARLQFIEFFLQFFEGGGREFRPFRRAIL